MSKESVKQFSQIASKNSNIQERIKEATDRETLVNLAVELGTENGLSFTAKEVKEFYEEELTKAKKANINRLFNNFNIIAGASLSNQLVDPSICDDLDFLAREICKQEIRNM